MRKITKRITDAFLAGHSLEVSNSKTDGKSLWLFGNKIADITENGVLMICDGGYGVSRTTAERLNALPNVKINIKNGSFLLDGESWDGTWVKIIKIK